MVFTVLCAVDFHAKCNFELVFPGVPSISELREKVETVLSAESALRRPAGVPVAPFIAHRVQVFDERMEMWVDLVSTSQLADYCQIYVFQRESPWHKDTPGRIPPPVKPFSPGGDIYSIHRPVPISPPVASGSPLVMPVTMVDPISNHVNVSPTRQRPTYSMPPPVVLPTPPPPAPVIPMSMEYDVLPELITHSEKVRVVYDELDARKARTVSYDDWSTLFTRLRLTSPDGPFTDETVHDLFHKKADRNEDGYVSFSEFQVFSEMYPKLLDSMYFRCRDQVQHDLRSQNMEQARMLQQELEKRRDEAQDELADSENQIEAAEENNRAANDAVEAAKDVEKDARAQKDAAHSETEDVRSKLRDAQGERDRAKEGVRQKDSALRCAVRGVDTAVKKEKSTENDLDKAKRELERLQKLVENQMKEVERQQQLVADAGQAIETAKSKVHDQESAKGEAESELAAAQEKVQEIDGELKQAMEAESKLAQAHRDTVKEVNQAQAHKTQEDQDLSKLKTKELQRKAALERAIRSLEDHEKVLSALEDKDRDMIDRRAQEEARENEILEQEVRLREQRETMERKEEALRNAHQDFTTDIGRVSPTRGRPSYTTNLSA
eukprot:TRINITY_DN6533_c3_g1_i1.p1 TRINITY_DN6533_c3_g1~~TRINITY_DN6533_c3_g1_i1.p1  ORF type:complete len:609 (+),score=160.92 TRINITY_DN6533_c3_g1_i1:55-1881(+)